MDGDGNAFFCGNFSSAASFGPQILKSMGEGDIFTAKLDSEGNWLWVRVAGSEGVFVGRMILGETVEHYQNFSGQTVRSYPVDPQAAAFTCNGCDCQNQPCASGV